MSGKARKGDPPHIGLAVLSAGAMALALSGGLQFLGLMGRLDEMFASVFSPPGLNKPALALGPAVIWLSGAALAFALPAVILNIPGAWRRLVVWGGAVALTVSWGPVLVLAAHKPQIGVALVAVLWSGVCAMFYTTNHVLPADSGDATRQPKNDGTR